jgi:hypothetical protein
MYLSIFIVVMGTVALVISFFSFYVFFHIIFTNIYPGVCNRINVSKTNVDVNNKCISIASKIYILYNVGGVK